MLRQLKRGTRGSAVLLLAALVSRCEAAPPDVPVGTWTLRCTSPDGKARSCVVTVRREGDTLKGTYTADGVTRAAREISFARGVLSIRVDGQFAGQHYGLTYKGKPVGDSLRGTVRWSYGFAAGSFAFEGERVGEKLAATP